MTILPTMLGAVTLPPIAPLRSVARLLTPRALMPAVPRPAVRPADVLVLDVHARDADGHDVVRSYVAVRAADGWRRTA